MDITSNIQPLTCFLRKSAEAVTHLKATRRPMLLTINGKAQVVVQDVRSYQRLLDIAARTDAGEAVGQGLQDVARRRTRPASRVFNKIRREYGFPR